MTEFKVGDLVRRFRGGHNDGMDIGDTGIIGSIDNWINVRRNKDGNISMGNSPENLELITTNMAETSIIEKFKTSLLKEPLKSFRKAGITNGDNMLTSDGQAMFLSYLLEKNGDAFKADVVDALLADEKN